MDEELKSIEERRKRVELAIAGLNKEFGAGTVVSGSTIPSDVPFIPTGNFKLDMVLGVGGLPKGRVVEIFGPEAVGKTLLALNTVAKCQQEGGLAAYVDAEHALDPVWMKKIGIDIEALVICQPDSGEQALQVVLRLAQTGAFDMIVVDSVAALVPLKELEGEIGDAHVAMQARLISQAMRILTPALARSQTLVIFINQLRDNISPMAHGGSVTPGGRALKFYSSVRIELRKVKGIEDSSTGESVGIRVKAKVLKNKVAVPLKEVEYDIYHGVGFNNFTAILELALKNGLIMKKGNWFYRLEDNKVIGNGERQAGANLASDLDFANELKEKIIYNYRVQQGYIKPEEKELELETNAD